MLEERALLPAVRVRSTVQSLAVLNDDAKTVVRLAIEYAEAVSRAAGASRSPRGSTVEPVLGYDDELEQTRGACCATGSASRRPTRPLLRRGGARGRRAPGGHLLEAEDRRSRAGTRTDEAAGVVLRRLLEIAEANLPGTIADLDTEFLHDLRVSVRRARSVLRELKGVFTSRSGARGCRDELKWAQA